MAKVFVIKNEQHSLLQEQEEILSKEYGSFEIVNVPSSGWNIDEMKAVKQKLENNVVVFVSPVPFLLKELAVEAGVLTTTVVRVFHNDRREKKELPNGKIIQVVAQTGWQLV